MKVLRQSTASQEIPIGRMVDATDGVTAETGLTIANTDIKIWKTGATTLADKNSGGATHISAGIYYATLDATDTNTLGPIKFFVSVSGALPWEDSYTVLPAAIYDALIAGTEWLHVDPLKVEWTLSGGTLTVKKPDDTTTDYTKTVTGTAGADPVTGVA